MTATPYRAINWNPNDLIGDDKMDQLVNNTQWLYENTPRATYSLPSGLTRVEGVRIACGRVVIPASKSDISYQNVTFGNLFSTGCAPIITTGINVNSQTRMSVIINGLGTTLTPDSRGFQVAVNVAAENTVNDYIKSNLYVNWIAMGY